MGSRRGPITAGELVKQLENDPEYQRRIAAREAQVRAWTKRVDKATAPIIAELTGLGVEVPEAGLRVMANFKVDYRKGIPILIRWLEREDLDVLAKAEVASALATKWAKPVAAEPTIREIDRALAGPDPLGDRDTRWLLNMLGNSLIHVVDASVTDDLLRLLKDERLREFRAFIALALGKIKGDPRIVDALIENLSDDQIVWDCVKALGDLRAARAKPFIEPFLDDEVADMRKVARSALAKIDKNPSSV